MIRRILQPSTLNHPDDPLEPEAKVRDEMQLQRRSGFARVSFIFLLASAACASLLWLSGRHRGQYAVQFSTEGYATDGLGTRFGGIFDRLTIAPVSGTVYLD